MNFLVRRDVRPALLNQPTNAGWTKIEPVVATGWVWRAVAVYHLPGEDNMGKHNVFVDLFDEHGNYLDSLPGAQLSWSWDGQQGDETAKPAAFDKRAPEPLTNTPIEKHQVLTIWVDGSYPSDRVSGLTSFPDDESGKNASTGNSEEHNSYWVAFQKMMVQEAPKPVTPPAPVVTPAQPNVVPNASQPDLATVVNLIAQAQALLNQALAMIGLKG